MTKLKRTSSDNPDFQNLVFELDKDLAKRNGETNHFFAQFNKSNQLKHVVLAYAEKQVVGCGALKEFDKNSIEIKRMFVPFQLRSQGIASKILHELENWSKELGYKKCVLETGNKMPEAIALYKKNNFRIIPNYGQYEGIESSICFEKLL